MKDLKQTAVMLIICILAAVTGSAQDLAAFKLPDSTRGFLFNLRRPSETVASGRSTNGTPRGIEGFQTVMARGFKTTQRAGVVTVTFMDALICYAHRTKGDESGASVMQVGEMSIGYPAGTSVLVLGRAMPLADLSEKSFADSSTFGTVYNGEAAVKKLKEMRLEPPADMDWEKATNHGSSQPKH